MLETDQQSCGTCPRMTPIENTSWGMCHGIPSFETGPFLVFLNAQPDINCDENNHPKEAAAIRNNELRCWET